jgi:hypothetical protein
LACRKINWSSLFFMPFFCLFEWWLYIFFLLILNCHKPLVCFLFLMKVSERGKEIDVGFVEFWIIVCMLSSQFKFENSIFLNLNIFQILLKFPKIQFLNLKFWKKYSILTIICHHVNFQYFKIHPRAQSPSKTATTNKKT